MSDLTKIKKIIRGTLDTNTSFVQDDTYGYAVSMGIWRRFLHFSVKMEARVCISLKADIGLSIRLRERTVISSLSSLKRLEVTSKILEELCGN
jgi:hypothetical protein